MAEHATNKEPVRVIAAKIPETLYDECAAVKDHLNLDTMNELVKRALNMYLRVHHVSDRTDSEDTTQFTSSKRSKGSIKEKVRTHQGKCIICGKRIPHERIAKNYNDAFCSPKCEDHFYTENGIPRNIGFRIVHRPADVSFVLASRRRDPTLLQYVLLYDRSDGIPEIFKPLGSDR